MEPAIHQESTTTGEQFKGYIRSFQFFKLPAFLLFACIGGVLLIILGIDTVLSEFDLGTKIVFVILALFSFVFVVSSIWITYIHIKDTVQLKVKVRTVELKKIKIDNNKTINYYLEYMYQKKVRSIEIHKHWVEKLTPNLPCQAVIYTTYHSGKILMIELIENKETFSVV